MSETEIRNQIMMGKHSIINNLPHPKIRVIDNHAFLFPSECLFDAIRHKVVCEQDLLPKKEAPCKGLYLCNKTRELVTNLDVGKGKGWFKPQ